MEFSTLIGISIVLTGVLLLEIVAMKRRAVRKKEKKEQKLRAEVLEKEQLEETRRRAELLKKLDFRRGGPVPRPSSLMEVPKERSMILCYNTVFLTDVSHPARVYKADLFHPAYVGRSRDNDICIREESVSRRHMRIFRDGALVYAENLNSINGTLLDGKRLTRPQEIISGSRLTLGRVELKVEID